MLAEQLNEPLVLEVFDFCCGECHGPVSIEARDARLYRARRSSARRARWQKSRGRSCKAHLPARRQAKQSQERGWQARSGRQLRLPSPPLLAAARLVVAAARGRIGKRL